MADPNSLHLARSSVLAAHTLITPYIHRTPVLTSTYLDQLASTPRTAAELADTPWAGQAPANPKIRLWFKCENFQKVGAFKARGAFHSLLRLVESEGWEEGGGRERGVVTHSSGEFLLRSGCCLAERLPLGGNIPGTVADDAIPQATTPKPSPSPPRLSKSPLTS
jgi:threonine dehydratase